MAPASIEMLPPAPIYWRFAIEKRRGNFYLQQLKLFPTDNGAIVMHKLRAQYEAVIHKAPYGLWDRAPLLWYQVIETATLSINSSTDLESQQDTRVFVTRRKYHDDLTAAFHDPQILSNASDFIRDNDQFSAHPEGRLSRNILLIRIKSSMLLMISLYVALCLGTGILTGVLTGNADLGVSVSSAVIALIACLQTTLVILRT